MLSAKECNGHEQTEHNDSRADQRWIQTSRDSSTGITADDGRDKHYRRLCPPHLSRDDKQNNRRRIHHSSQQGSPSIHRVNVAQACKTPYREYDDANRSTKVAAVDSDKIMKYDEGLWADP